MRKLWDNSKMHKIRFEQMERHHILVLNIIYMTTFPKLISKFSVIQMKTGAILAD